ncbi:MAG: hypothetical protein GY760_05080 [Deltaproteobacteria bacterium]|nr:hypothetical protein [Deltaproteobacteria bacterium]
MNNTKSKKFDLIDPFNLQNRVEGFIYKSKSRFGDMKITSVNGSPCEQYIFGTPKILHLSKNLHQVKSKKYKVFEKIDGTNVLMFRYIDIKNNEYISYKTRLSPFLRPQPYGNFIKLWKTILSKYEEAFSELKESENYFGFELFGSTLRILTDYKTDLDAKLLYAIDPANGRVLSLDYEQNQTFPKTKSINVSGDIHKDYNDLLSLSEKKVKSGKPFEGVMFYFDDGNFSNIYKLKPPEVITRQKKYGELYSKGKELSKKFSSEYEILNNLKSYINKNWEEDLSKKYSRIIEIANEDISNEVKFNNSKSIEITKKEDKNLSNQTILWRSVWGSHLWGMENKDSDKDCCVVYQADTRTILLGAFDNNLMQIHHHGTRSKSCEFDDHYYELGRAVQLILKGSLTVLYGVMSPIVVDQHSTALEELQELIIKQPSTVFYKVLMRDVRDSEKAMDRSENHDFYLKHLRIACRNLRFGITLFSKNRYEFLPSYAEDPQELFDLKMTLVEVYEKSELPDRFDSKPFEDYILSWRKKRFEMDFND